MHVMHLQIYSDDKFSLMELFCCINYKHLQLHFLKTVTKTSKQCPVVFLQVWIIKPDSKENRKTTSGTTRMTTASTIVRTSTWTSSTSPSTSDSVTTLRGTTTTNKTTTNRATKVDDVSITNSSFFWRIQQQQTDFTIIWKFQLNFRITDSISRKLFKASSDQNFWPETWELFWLQITWTEFSNDWTLAQWPLHWISCETTT